jgi:hypothetical protein
MLLLRFRRLNRDTMTDCTIDVTALTAGSQTANSINPSCFNNPADTVFANTNFTPLSTKYLAASSNVNYVVDSTPEGNMRDVELTTWVRDGYVFLRLDGNGNAVYFSHNGDGSAGNGVLNIGIVTGVSQLSYPSGTYYPLYQNNDCAHTITGYNSTDTTGAAFTFGVSGFDIYAKFNGTEFCRFKEYRQMNAGIVAMKANSGYGFRSITLHPLTIASVLSNYAANEIDLRDFDLRSIQTKGSITANSNSLVCNTVENWRVGDWVIVEIGAEAGAGVRGTVGVGGQWPALKYADAAAMNADVGQAVNTFAWRQNDGAVYQWNGGSWIAQTIYYTAKAIPLALHGRISQIVGSTLTLTQSNGAAANAAVTATGANVYLDVQPYLNYLTALQKSGGFYADLTPITPTGTTIIFPAGTYFGSGRVKVSANTGWVIKGQGQGSTILWSPKGATPLQIHNIQTNNCIFRDFTLQSNFRLQGFGLLFPGWTWLPGGFNTAGVMLANVDSGESGSIVSQTNIPQGSAYPVGIFVDLCFNTVVQDVTINDVSQKAVGVNFGSNTWAYRVTNNQSDPLQTYTQWQFQWANTIGGGCVDCVVNSAFLVPGFESFAATDHQMIRPISINAGFSQNNSQGWKITDAVVTITAGSATPEWDKNNPVFNINANIGADNTARGGLISNPKITVQGYINAGNDLPCGVNINSANPNVTVRDGFYRAPGYAAPSILPGPQGVRSTGLNTEVIRFECHGAIGSPDTTVNRANIGVLTGNVYRCSADLIVVGTGTVVDPTVSGVRGLWAV